MLPCVRHQAANGRHCILPAIVHVVPAGIFALSCAVLRVTLGLHITTHQQLACVFAAAQEADGLTVDSLFKQHSEGHLTGTPRPNLLIWFRFRSFHGGKFRGSSSSTPAWPSQSPVPHDVLTQLAHILWKYVDHQSLPYSGAGTATTMMPYSAVGLLHE
jgi:hypothetical protein